MKNSAFGGIFKHNSKNAVNVVIDQALNILKNSMGMTGPQFSIQIRIVRDYCSL